MFLDWGFAVFWYEKLCRTGSGLEGKPTRHQAIISIGWQSGQMLKNSLKAVMVKGMGLAHTIVEKFFECALHCMNTTYLEAIAKIQRLLVFG